MNFQDFEQFENDVRVLVSRQYPTLSKDRREQLDFEFLGLKSNKEWMKEYERLYLENKVSNMNKNGLIIPFVLGLTNLDPIANQKQPTQWIQEGDSPDIDTDCEDRDRLFEILLENFEKDGKKRVAPISNFNAVTVKSGIKDAARFHGVEFKEVNELTKLIPDKIDDEDDNEVESKFQSISLLEEKIPQLKDFMQRYPQVKSDAELIVGQYRAISRHAGGVVITDDIDTIAPMTYSRGVIQTGYTDGIASRVGADMGFIKFDLLGLGTLRIISDCIHDIICYNKEKWLHLVEEWAETKTEYENEDGIKMSPFDYSSSEFRNFATKKELKHRFKFISVFYENVLSPSVIDIEDQNVYKNVYQEGRFAGVFQMESEGMRKCTRSFLPNCIEDIFAAVAIYRPGPLAADADKLYAKNKIKSEQGFLESNHPIVDEIFEPTYGLLVYQEQLMEIAGKLGGISQKDVQKFRKIISKKEVDKHKEFIDKIYKQYLDNCIKVNYPENKAKKLWENLIDMGAYAFNLSHSASYGMISYITAWLLTYYKYEWYTAVLNNCKKDELSKLIIEITSDNVKIAPPDIIISKTNWTYSPEDKSIRFGLSDIKGVGAKAALSVIQARNKKEFDPHDVFSFFSNEHVSWRHCNKAKISSLIKAGAFDRYENQILHLFGKWSSFEATIKEYRDVFQEYGDQGVDVLNQKREDYLSYEKKKKEYDLFVSNGGDKNDKTIKPGKKYTKVETYWDIDEWTKKQKIEFFIDLLNFVPISSNVDEFLYHISDLNIKSIDKHIMHNKSVQPVWFRIMAIEKKKTSKGKDFMILKVMGEEKIETVKCWSPEHFKGGLSDFVVAQLEYDSTWGFSIARGSDNFSYGSF